MAVPSSENRISVSTPPQVVARPLDDELVLLNLDTETYFGLDEVGTRMLQVLQQSTSFGAAVATLVAEYEVDEATLRADLESLVDRLVENGLVELHEA